MSTNSALIRFQRRILSDMETELRQSVGPIPPSLKKYHAEYGREFLQFQSHSSFEELIQKIRDCNIVYCGDYHSLRQSQMTNLNLMTEIIQSRKIILATELVYSDQQPLLDSYLKGALSQSEFLNNIEYDRNFGFDWNNYKPIFDFAAQNSIRVIAIDYRHSKKTNLYLRDRHAAKIISAVTRSDSDALLWVMVGDLHLAKTHLPGFVEKQLEGKGLRRRILIIHQNNERLFWKVASQRLPGRVEILKMDEQAYCILNTPPWMKLQSYVSWLEKSHDPAKMVDEVHRILVSLLDFLRIDEPSLLDFTVYSGKEPAFLAEFHPKSQTYRFCKRKYQKGESFFIPSRRLIYLHSSDLDRAVEICARYIHVLCSNFKREQSRCSEEIFRRICHRALGFLGSKILNHHRDSEPQETLTSVDFLGQQLGANIFTAMLKDQLTIKEVRELYYQPFENGAARKLFLRFSERPLK